MHTVLKYLVLFNTSM